MRPRGLHVHFFLFSSYPTADLEATERQYERHKLSEGWVRGGKPMSAGIVWVRRLLAYVEAPMEQFGRWPALLSAPESKKIVRRYNRLAETLVQAELVWCRGWGASLDRLPAALAAPLLARSEGRLVVNLQSSTLLALQEVPQFRRLGLRSAWDPATLLKHRARLEGAYNRLRSVLQAGPGGIAVGVVLMVVVVPVNWRVGRGQTLIKTQLTGRTGRPCTPEFRVSWCSSWRPVSSTGARRSKRAWASPGSRRSWMASCTPPSRSGEDRVYKAPYQLESV